MTVFVIMANDYPDCVFMDERKALAYCNEQNSDPDNRRPNSTLSRIFYRIYPFEVKK